MIGRNGWCHVPLEAKINTQIKWLLNTDDNYRRSLILSRIIFFSKILTCKWSVENYITYHFLLYVALINLFLYVRSSWGHILLQSRKFFFFPIESKLFSPRFGPLGLRNCSKKIVCLFVCLSVVCLSAVCLSNEICHRPSGDSFGPFCMKFGTLVYLWDT